MLRQLHTARVNRFRDTFKLISKEPRPSRRGFCKPRGNVPPLRYGLPFLPALPSGASWQIFVNMGLTWRKDSFYVEFRVIDDGKTYRLAWRVPGARLKRWKVNSLNRAVAKQVWVEQRFLPAFGANRLLTAITSESIEAYYQGRRKEVSLVSANRELAAIKHIFSWACGAAPKLKRTRPDLDRNPASAVWKEKEDNVRDEILEPAQFEDLQANSTEYLRPINLVAYATGMRWGEIVNLTWAKVDLKGGFVRLTCKDTKSGDGRSIPLDVFAGLREMFKELHKTRALHEPHVFLNGGRPVRSLKGGLHGSMQGGGNYQLPLS